MLGTALGHTQDSSSKDDLFRRLVDSIKDYAIFVLSPEGEVLTWNLGAEALMGYSKHEILGTHCSKFYLPEAVQSGLPAEELAIAEKEGRFANECWHSRKDGSTFWACVVITPLRGSTGELCGFAKVTQDITERREAAERITNLNLELQRLSAEVLQVQDDERRRIARELHDDLGQQLLAIKMFVDKTKNDEAIELADLALSWVRNLAYLLHPPLLDEVGLTAALNWFVDGLAQRSNIRVELKIQPNTFPRLGTDIETAIFRIVQESLTNVFRHSNSDRATVELEKENEQVTVRIRDYGKGLPDTGEPTESKVIGVGIAGMRERIRQFGGQLKVSRCEPGTMVAASMPLPTDAI
jgi:PAS domain S-box-containing protein